MRKLLLLLVLTIFIYSCTQPEPPQATVPENPKMYRVVQNGKLVGYDLRLLYDQLSSATFKTRDGKTVVYHGSFYYEEM